MASRGSASTDTGGGYDSRGWVGDQQASPLSGVSASEIRGHMHREGTDSESFLSRFYDPCTVGGAIAVTLRKEFLNLWASSSDASRAAINSQLVDIILSTISPPLVDAFLGVANRRTVDGRLLNPSTILPAVHTRIDSLTGAHGDGGGTPRRSGRRKTSSAGIALVEHVELLEELHSLLGSRDLLVDLGENNRGERFRRDVAAQLPSSHPWQRWFSSGQSLLLPSDVVYNVCTVVSLILISALKKDETHRITDAGQEQEAGGSAGRGRASSSPPAGDDPVYDKDSLPAGAPQGLARAMRCRQRVFALERELAAREQAERNREMFEKSEREKSEARLMEVNIQLEKTLKARAEELRRATARTSDAQRAAEDARSQLAEKKREVAQLKYRLEQDTNLQKSNLVREREHSRSLLRAAARANVEQRRIKERAEQLRQCILGVPVAELLESEVEANRQEPTDLIGKMEAEFEFKLRRRKEQYDAALDEFQRTIDRKRQECNELDRRLKESNAVYYSMAGAMNMAIHS
eukprot:TRINITY_DN16359_c0_g1_i1.p1 TRINITY_DN16359_c0_g1~~TRINITY_DN16359_c0_g1_i1.p1  ORF type:complete len:533 (-),score=109.20 TRINITY_DN16359_c0_g1_i1:29-1594(-)